MAFDVFALREKVVQEYGDYFRSFVNIADDRISAWAEERLNEHTYWPDPVLQLNPAFEQGSTLASLANEGIIHRSTAAFFGPDMRLHRHQEEALHKAQEQKPYLVTTGTGSGKSLTYLLPIVDAILRNRPEVESTRAIIIYPMNALINSQLEALERYRRNDPGTRLTFQRYTGQDIGKERENILAHPPHILLTNFVMADYLMMRPAERAFFQALLGGESDLQFIVLDEMHVHRGRQGADVAMTVRRLRQRARADVQLIGTSATIVTEGGRQDRRIATAAVGSTLLGVLIEPDSVIDETLTATSFARLPEGQAEVAASVLAPAPLANELAVRNHPLAAWVEQTFGIDQDDNGRLVRRRPITLKAGLDKLVAASGLERSICDKALKDILEAGYAANREHPVFAFRLHQFLSSGSSVYSTLEPAAHRQLTLAGQRFLEAQSDTGGRRMLVPMAFCRECGQEHLLVTLVRIEGNLHAIPRSALNTWQSASADDEGDEMDASVRTGAGYLVFETTGDADRLHSGEIDDLPEAWLEVMKRTGVRIKKNYQRHRPQELWVSPDGTVYRQPQPGLPRAWFQPTPIRVCLHCRESWSAAQRSDFGKLSTFSQTGRSTATTLVTTSAIQHLRNMQPGSSANKVLSFTDNRQDAALQAGHMNDFVQVAMVRSALATVVHQQGASLSYHDLGHAIASALNLPAVNLLRDTTPDGSIPEAAREAFEDLLTFRAIEDLRRAWRVNMPNLEEAGLLRIGYAGLDEIADSDARWQGVPFMNALDGPARFTILTALLNHFRSLLAIDYPGLTREGSKRLIRRVQEELRDPWTIDEFDRLRQGQIVRMPGVPEPPARLRLLTVGSGSQSTIGKYLRDKRTWNRFDPLTVPDLEAVFTGIVDALTGTLLTRDTKTQGLDGVQLKTSVLRWEPGSNERPAFDVVRTRGAHERRAHHQERATNLYFRKLYTMAPVTYAGMTGREHTAQVRAEDRVEREKRFREGSLPALFCTGTMELGVDIADLSVVHMRNVPPTPANYAQRSGRAGRSGQPALVVTSAADGSPHDRYYFDRSAEMISGVVKPARMDLGNEQLVRNHVHAMWLAQAGFPLGRSIDEVLDLDEPMAPLVSEIAQQTHLSGMELAKCRSAIASIVAAEPAITRQRWFTESWIDQTLAETPEAFDRAFDRWRELYRAAHLHRDQARRIQDRLRVSNDERRAAEQLERAAKRELDQLTNKGTYDDGDFYPYRYLAAEGFLSGFNFPLLPLRLFVSGPRTDDVMTRPRFLGLREYGPNNVVYHEGRTFRVIEQSVPPDGLEGRLLNASICRACGYLHRSISTAERSDRCLGCNAELTGSANDELHDLLEQGAGRAVMSTRINSGEEERLREGYRITTHFAFAPGIVPQQYDVITPGNTSLFTFTIAPQTELWQINRGWRSRGGHEGFKLDMHTGRWSSRDEEHGDEQEVDAAEHSPTHRVFPFVRDTRNVVLFDFGTYEKSADADTFRITFANVLIRGLEIANQLEEGELAGEFIGDGDQLRFLCWETVEGGTGAWERLETEPVMIQAVARAALDLCHMASDGADHPDRHPCGGACYACLMSYRNQREHMYLDRSVIRPTLAALSTAVVVPRHEERTFEGQRDFLYERTDPASTLEREFLDYLVKYRCNLPSAAQNRPDPAIYAQPDFFYEQVGTRGACIFVDGASHSSERAQLRDAAVRDRLYEAGFQVISVRAGAFAEAIAAHPAIFGQRPD